MLSQRAFLPSILPKHSRPSFPPLPPFHLPTNALQVIGNQSGVRALFQRYDFDGDGLVIASELADCLMSARPDAASSSLVRNAYAILRRCIASRLGNHGVRHFQGILKQAAISSGAAATASGDFITTVDLTVLVLELGMRPSDVTTITANVDPETTGLIAIDQLLDGIRGALSMSRRQLIERAWTGILERHGAGTADSISVDDLARQFSARGDSKYTKAAARGNFSSTASVSLLTVFDLGMRYHCGS
jgi:hypothetical protein